MLFSFGGSTLLTGGNIYTSAEVAGAPSWLTLSSDGTNNLGSSYTQSNAGALTPIHIRTQSNEALLAVNQRSSEVFLSRATEGRVKVHAKQDVECFMYVGMFGGALVEVTPGVWQFSKPLYIQCKDELTGIVWGPNPSTTTATNTWNGRANTWAIRATTYPAANRCFQKNKATISGVNDVNNIWFLPAQTQLMACWGAANSFDTDKLFNGALWSATQESVNNAWRLDINGNTSNRDKSSNFRLRCVREE